MCQAALGQHGNAHKTTPQHHHCIWTSSKFNSSTFILSPHAAQNAKEDEKAHFLEDYYFTLLFFFLPQWWLGNIEGPINFKSTKHMKLVRAAASSSWRKVLHSLCLELLAFISSRLAPSKTNGIYYAHPTGPWWGQGQSCSMAEMRLVPLLCPVWSRPWCPFTVSSGFTGQTCACSRTKPSAMPRVSGSVPQGTGRHWDTALG